MVSSIYAENGVIIHHPQGLLWEPKAKRSNSRGKEWRIFNIAKNIIWRQARDL